MTGASVRRQLAELILSRTVTQAVFSNLAEDAEGNAARRDGGTAVDGRGQSAPAQPVSAGEDGAPTD